MELKKHQAPEGYVYERRDGLFQTYVVAMPESEDINKNYQLVKTKEEK